MTDEITRLVRFTSKGLDEVLQAKNQGLKAAVSDFLEREREGVLAYAEQARSALPYRQA